MTECVNGCGFTRFRTFQHCCTHCQRTSGSNHAKDCDVKNKRVAAPTPAPAPSRAPAPAPAPAQAPSAAPVSGVGQAAPPTPKRSLNDVLMQRGGGSSGSGAPAHAAGGGGGGGSGGGGSKGGSSASSTPSSTPRKRQRGGTGGASSLPKSSSQATATSVGGGKRIKLGNLVPPQQQQLGKNDECASVFEQMGHIYKITGDVHRHSTYIDGAAAVRAQTTAITDGKTAKKNIKGVGKALGDKIDEILATGTCNKFEALKQECAVELELGKVHGIGPKLAKELIQAYGVTSLASLEAKAASGEVNLTGSQTIGLKHLADLQLKIPRSEVGEIGASVKAAAAKVDPSIIVTICGSFRRGKKSSGDIDIHITRPNFKLPQKPGSANNPLKSVVAALKANGLITDTLSHGGQKYQGVCKLDPSTGHHRRIDIMSTVMDQYYTGICYFTGSGAFNRALRQYAVELGFTLNEHALIQKCRCAGCLAGAGAGACTNGSTKIEINSEDHIFEALGVQYYLPTDREFGK